MLVYLTAFALTWIFASLAARYYKRYRKVCVLYGTKGGGISLDRIRLSLFTCQTKYNILFVLAFLPLFFVSAVRYDVGTDYFYTYIPNFYKILGGDTHIYSEYGFILLNIFIQYFTRNAQWLIVVTSFIYSFVLVRTIVKYSDNTAISIMVLFFSCLYFASLNNVRQAIASVIIFSSFPHILNGKFFKFCIYLLLALIFHLSAIIMIVPFFIINIKFIKRYFLFFAALATFSLPILCKILEWCLLSTKYAYFFNSAFNNGRATKVNIIYHLFFFLLSCVFSYKQRMKDKTAYVLLVMQFFAFWVSAVSLFISISEMIMRVTLFFQIFQIFLIPHLYKIQDGVAEKVLIVGAYFSLYAIYMIYYIVIKNYHAVLPYQWIF